MSKNVQNNKSFLDLLLNTSKEQALALLYTLTKPQLALITEIAYNILELPLPTKAQSHINKKKKLFQRLGSAKVSNSSKQAAIEKNASVILHVLHALRQQLSELQ